MNAAPKALPVESSRAKKAFRTLCLLRLTIKAFLHDRVGFYGTSDDNLGRG